MIRGYVTCEKGDTIELKPLKKKPHVPINGKTIDLKALEKIQH